MAKPTTRGELIDYCLRQLGAPILEINVAEEQTDDLLDDALQYFQERHFDGVEKMYLKYQITQSDIDSVVLHEGQDWRMFDQEEFFANDQVIPLIKTRFKDYLDENA